MSGVMLAAVQGDLTSPLRVGEVDVLIFNPPYVPTPELPRPSSKPDTGTSAGDSKVVEEAKVSFEESSHLLELAYAGGKDGMETTDRLLADLPQTLSARGCAYILLCAQNRPEEVKQRIRGFGSSWRAETVRTSGRQAGWESLQVVRAWREHE
jgi:release factor glutamine methyltransferase